MTVPQAHPPEPASFPEPVLEDAERRLAELTEAVAARDNFIAVAAHELRNPMTPIIGQLELLLKGVRADRFASDQIEARLERIHRSMGHYLKRAATLLDVARISSGKFRIMPAPCDLADVIRLVVDNFDEAARHVGARLDINAPQSLPGSWDRLALEQIIDNLVSNAIKYGGGSPILLSVADPQGDSRVVIEVRDRGPGISPRNKERIFGQFERAIGADERQTGFGVGLWVVGQIVEAMEGTITVDDAHEGGTIFRVVLPRYLKAGRHD